MIKIEFFIIVLMIVLVAFLAVVMSLLNSKKKMLEQIKTAKNEKRQLQLTEDICLDFQEEPWVSERKIIAGVCKNIKTEKGKYYLVTRCFPTGNKKIELLKYDDKSLVLPEFTTAIMELNVQPYVE